MSVGFVRSSLGIQISYLELCLWFSVADPLGAKRLERTEFSRLGASGMEDWVETPWKMGILGGYTELSVGRQDGFLNDWHCADLLCTGTSQQFDWLAA